MFSSKGFLLQRTEQDVKVIDGHWRSIRKLVDSIAPDVQGINAWRYQRQVSPGMQEYVEALAFERYLTSGDMVDLTTSGHFDNVLVDNKVTEDDYVLGLCDLTGEMMRFAVTSMATNGTLLKTYSTGRSGEENTRTILSDLRSISAHLEGLVTNSSSSAQTPLTRELLKKLEVTRESVEKVEKAAYGLAIRGRERSKRWIPSVMGPDSGTAE